MKNYLLFLFGLILSTTVLAQTPQGISHQAVMRDSDNNLIIESPIGLQVSILQGAHDGNAVYVETHQVTSNQNGLITYIIGEGVAVEGVFEEIDWSDGPYWLETKADPTGGTDYSISGVTKFLSVPYAIHASTADKAETLKDGSHLGEIIYWDGENWVPITPGEHNQTLRLCDGVPTWGPCLYELVLFTDPLDGGSVTGEGEYEEGTEVSITAIPNQGWEFAGWTGDTDNVDDVDSGQTTVTMPADNISLTANFQEEVVPTLFSLHLEVHPEGAGAVLGEGEYEEGELVNVTATANQGWEFVNWTGDTQHLNDANSAEAIVTMPADNILLTAVFQQSEDPEPGTVTDIDGNVYQTVIIGNQEWMAENLRVTRYNNEDEIPTGLSNTEWSNTTSGAYAIYNNDDNILEAYGKLYNWYAVDDSRGLCPEGWSVPSDADWTALVNYVVSQGFPNSNVTNGAGNALKSCRQVGHPDGGDCDTSEHPRWNSHGTHSGFDEFGFSALPGGGRWSGGSFYDVGGGGIWWSATEGSGTSAWYRGMFSSIGDVYRGNYGKRDGFSLRCFRDN